jgi:hypothetical protein
MDELTGLLAPTAPGSVEQPVRQSLGWFTIAIISSLSLVSFWFYSRIRLSRQDHGKILKQLGVRVNV